MFKAPQIAQGARYTEEEIDQIAERLHKAKKNVVFSLATTGPFRLSGYTNTTTGQRVIFRTRKPKDGPEIKATVHKAGGQELSRQELKFNGRSLTVPYQDLDIIKALMKHPECKGSPNRKGQSTFFFQDPEGEKALQMSAMEAEQAASAIAYGLKGFELALASARSESHTRDEDSQRLHIYQYAKNRPQKFSEWFTKKGAGFEMKEVEYIRALVTIAIREGIITRKGRDSMYEWGEIVVGDSHATIAEKLSAKPEMKSEIEIMVKEKLGFAGKTKK